ncbi:MAG TPA: hypothetical protein VMB71_15320, partial [Acetobacteraceae bacterium]|nr:hypothetical protein [Acetobacteraceae bacterium]
VGIDLTEATRIAALAVSVCASQTGLPVATAEELLAALTPAGQARRKIMPPQAAAAQIAHWRQAGLRTGLVIGEHRTSLASLRRACDRLVLALEAPEEAALAAAAALPAIDLVSFFPVGTRRDTLTTLRPDLLLEPEAGEALTALVESWGGAVLSL